ncbi:MAG: HAD-IB family hydrolase [Clostridia bacterium]|nr:HAD-IB family hydrolase [Clostridia bacterium]
MTIPTAFAFFDFDDTLAKGDSILPYLIYCIRQGIAPRSQLFKAACGFIGWKLNPKRASAAKQATLSYIRGRTLDEMDEIARSFFREVQTQRFFEQGTAELWKLRQQGVKIVVVSASADVYMRVLPEFLPVDAVLSTTCMVKDGCYTGAVGPNCKGKEKPRRIAQWLAEQSLSIDKARSSGYGDSPSDAPMLLLTSSPTLVNPKKKLSRKIPDGRIVRWR